VVEEFKAFALRGNVVDLAIAVVLGTAFARVVDSLVFEINGSQFNWGNFVTAVIAFIIVALVLFFFVVKPMTSLMKRAGLLPPVPPAEEAA
jgi:large conductance mechanosensitive channel